MDGAVRFSSGKVQPGDVMKCAGMAMPGSDQLRAGVVWHRVAESRGVRFRLGSVVMGMVREERRSVSLGGALVGSCADPQSRV